MRSTIQHSDPKQDILRDEGGAVMVMGLAMILGLIAFMWFMLGMGETLAFRDYMQEGADATAFTQPAAEALCMNIIVFINIVMMVMVAIYIIASVVVTLSWASSILCCPSPPWTCCLKIPKYIKDWNDRNKDAKNLLAKAAGFLSPMESVIGMAAPWVGFGLGIYVSTDYQMHSMPSKPIGLPITGMMMKLSTNLGSDTIQYGLPITHDHLGNQCEYLLEDLGALLGSFIQQVASYIGKGIQWYYCDDSLIPPELTSAFSDAAGTSHDADTGTTDKDGNSITQASPTVTAPGGSSDSGCNDSNGWSTTGGVERFFIGGGDGGHYWNCPKYGPMMNFKHGDGSGAKNPSASGHSHEFKNDADMMQTYSLFFIPSPYSDHDASRIIQFMQLQHMQGFHGTNTAPSTYGYYAQSELYFDCDDKWSSSSCDDMAKTDGDQDLTMYRFEWRARLVKVHLPGALGKIVNFINSVLGVVSSVRSFINGHGADEIVSLLDMIDQNLGTNLLNGIASIADPIPGSLAH